MKLLTNIKKSLYKFNYIDDVIRNKWILFKFNQAVKQGKLNQNQTTIHSDIIFRDEFNNLGLDHIIPLTHTFIIVKKELQWRIAT